MLAAVRVLVGDALHVAIADIDLSNPAAHKQGAALFDEAQDRVDLRAHRASAELALVRVAAQRRRVDLADRGRVVLAPVDPRVVDIGRKHQCVGAQLAGQQHRTQVLVDDRLDTLQALAQ